jgi:hypothetical protein
MMDASCFAVASAAAISICLHLLWLATNLRSYKAPKVIKFAILLLAFSIYAVFLGGSARYFRHAADSKIDLGENTNVSGF